MLRCPRVPTWQESTCQQGLFYRLERVSRPHPLLDQWLDPILEAEHVAKHRGCIFSKCWPRRPEIVNQFVGIGVQPESTSSPESTAAFLEAETRK